MVPTGTPPGQTPASQQQDTVTDVAVIPQVDDLGNLTDTAVILEKAGSVYFVTFYRQSTNTFYTGTDSGGTTLAFDATPELDQLMAVAGVRGSLTDLLAWTGAGQPQPGVPPAAGATQPLPFLAQLPGGQPLPPPAAQLGQPILNEPAARLIPINPNDPPATGTPGQYMQGYITVIQVHNGSITYYQKPILIAVQPNQAPPVVVLPGVPVYNGPNPPWVPSAINPQPAPGVVPLPGGFGIPFGRPAPVRPPLFPRR